jgi:hypothetical protein
MRRLSALIAILSLILAPALVLADEAVALSPTASASSPDTGGNAAAAAQVSADAKSAAASKAQADAQSQAVPAPELPDSGGLENEPAGNLKATAPAEVNVPKEDPSKQAPGKAVVEAPPSKYKLSNFILGFVGGALLGGAYGVLGTKDGGNIGANAAIYGGAAALALGTIGLFLGATTPEEAKPPRVDSALPIPTLILAARF